MTLKEFYAAMTAGDFDNDLDTINRFVSDRRQTLANKLSASLQKGSKVRISTNIRPKYMAGISGIFEGNAVKSGYGKIKVTDPHVIMRAKKYLDFNNCISAPMTCITEDK